MARAESELAVDGDFGALIRLARSGSAKAFGRLCDACRDYLLLVANRELNPVLRGKLGASDLVQDTLVKAYRAFDRFGGESEQDLLAWLRRILVHTLDDAGRRYVETSKRRLGLEVPLDPAQSSAALCQLVDPNRSPSSAVGADEEARRVATAMTQLPTDDRQVLRLRNWNGLSWEEVGQQMNRSPEAARKLWARAVERLADVLGSQTRAKIS